MTDLIQKFEQDCKANDVSPLDALERGGIHRTNWWRWKSEKVSPTLNSFGKAKEGLAAILSERPKRQTKRSAA